MKPTSAFLSAVLLTAAALATSGCRSHVVKVNLINVSRQPVTTIVIDYPGATFGKNQLDPGQTFLYPVKPLETGALKIQFADANGKTHTAVGPELHKNDEGMVDVRIDQEKAVAKLQLIGQ
jgi:outer membrane lipopolysaccharide assembly protein LptE/RlpB